MGKNKKKLLHIFRVLGLILIVSSCKTTYNIEVQILQPAQVIIPAQIKKVALVSHSNYKASRFVDENLRTYVLKNDSLRSNEYISAVYDVMNQSPRFTVVNTESIYLEKESHSMQNMMLTQDKIKEIGLKQKADALIVLESFSTPTKPSIKAYYVPEYNMYFGSLSIENSSLWKMYDVSGTNIIDEYVVTDTLTFETYANYDFEIPNNLPSWNDAVFESCYRAGKKYAERIAPTWIKEERFIYNYSNNDFLKASELAKNNKWLEAIEIWKKYPYGKKIKLAALASFNLAVACEVLDDFDAALEWASKSYFLNHDPVTEKYIKLIESRKAEKMKIEKQMNID
jgi:hypothetical protein